MGEPRAGRRHRQRADAGIAEQVERLARPRPAARASRPIAAPCRGRKRGGGTGCTGRGSGPPPSSAPSRSRGTGRANCQRPPPSSSEPGMNSPSASQSADGRRPQRLRLGADEAIAAVALELAAMAANRSGRNRPRARRRGSARSFTRRGTRAATPIVALARGPGEHASRRRRGPARASPPRAPRPLRPARPAGRRRRAGARHSAAWPQRALQRHQQAGLGLGARPLELALG